MKILVTGAAGFIGSSLTLALLGRGDEVVGIDNHNDYYDPKLKEARLKRFEDHLNYCHYRVNLVDHEMLAKIFAKHLPQVVVNLAAQAGVRYSIENPRAYVESNIVGFANIIQESRKFNVNNFVYASSSSVYGANTQLPFSTHNSANHPLSMYAATKRSNELMAHAYSHLFRMPTTGLRFFTAYGPWGRPDMALFKFTKSIIDGVPIQLFNNGQHKRDFTYIDDIVSGIMLAIDNPAKPSSAWLSSSPDSASSSAPWSIYNIGSNKPIELMQYLGEIEKALNKKANINFLPMQPGDVLEAHADISDLEVEFNYSPKTNISTGISNFINWYKSYYL